MKSIGERVKTEVFGLFEKGLLSEGEKLLRQLSFQLTDNDDTETKRLVLRNLSWVNHKLGNDELAIIHAKTIKAIVDADKKYKKENIIGFGDVENLISEICKDELSKEARIKINEENYNMYVQDKDNLDRALTALSTILLLEENFYDIESVISQIHNYMVNTLFEDEEKDKKMKCKLKEVEYATLQGLKLECPYIYKEIMENLSKQSNAVTAM